MQNDDSHPMPTNAPKRPSVTLRASHKQPSASPAKVPLSGAQANTQAAALLALIKPTKHRKS